MVKRMIRGSAVSQRRDAFLADVRRALGRDEPLAARPEPPGGRASLEEQERLVAEQQVRLDAKRPALVAALVAAAERGGWYTHRAAAFQSALPYLVELVRQRKMKLVVRSGQQVFQGRAVDAALTRAGARVVVMARDAGVGAPEGRLAALEADLGITGAEYAIAETGTVALLPGRGLSRLTSLTPPVHVAIVEADRIVETLEDLLALRKLAVLRGEELGSSMNLISGPSRSGDIEQTITIGVHGPKEVHLVVLEEPRGGR